MSNSSNTCRISDLVSVANGRGRPTTKPTQHVRASVIRYLDSPDRPSTFSARTIAAATKQGRVKVANTLRWLRNQHGVIEVVDRESFSRRARPDNVYSVVTRDNTDESTTDSDTENESTQ